MRKGIPDYEKKFTHLFMHQNGRCAITGAVLTKDKKIDMHHVYAKKGWRCKLYPLYIDSVWNLVLAFNDSHTTKTKPKPPPEWKIRKAEGLLAMHPGIEYQMDMKEALQELEYKNWRAGP